MGGLMTGLDFLRLRFVWRLGGWRGGGGRFLGGKTVGGEGATVGGKESHETV